MTDDPLFKCFGLKPTTTRYHLRFKMAAPRINSEPWWKHVYFIKLRCKTGLLGTKSFQDKTKIRQEKK